MSIPLPDMLRSLRAREYQQKLTPPRQRLALSAWAFLARRPRLYHFAWGLAARVLGNFGRGKGRFRSLPLAGGWTRARDLPAPTGESFTSAWRRRRGGTGS